MSFRPFSQQTFWLTTAGKADVSNDTMYWSVPVCWHAQYQNTETEAARWNSAVINFIYTCTFSHCEMSSVKKAYWARHLLASQLPLVWLTDWSYWPTPSSSLAVERLCAQITFTVWKHILLTAAQCDWTLNSHTLTLLLSIRWRFAND